MIIGGVETVFVNTINELSKNPNLDIKIVTHAKIREPLYVAWLRTHPEIPVYVVYPLQNFFEDLSKYCKIFPLKPLRKIVFSLYKKYRRAIVCKPQRFKDIDVFVDYKNFEFFKELRYFSQPKIGWAHSSLRYFESHGTLGRLPQYNRIVGITDDFVNDFNAKYPQYATRSVRIYNTMDFDEIRQKAKQKKTPSGKYFCHVSRLVKGKDIKTLLNGFDLFAQAHPDIQLYIVGDGDLALEFKAYAKTLKSADRIVFTGAMRNPYGIMRGAIANILSSEFEGFGMVLLESMVLGVPVISSRYKCGATEILQDGKAGMLFDIGNAEMLAECMTHVYKSPNVAKKLTDTATRNLKRFEVPVVSHQIHNLITKSL